MCVSPPPPHTQTHTYHTRTNAHRYIPPFGTRRPPQRRSVDYVTVLLPRAAHTPFPVLYVCVCCVCVFVCVCVCVCVCVFKLAFMHGYGRFTMFVCACVRAVCGCTYPQRPMLCPVQSAHECAHVVQFFVSRICTYLHTCIQDYVFMYVYVYAHVYECAHTQITGDPTK